MALSVVTESDFRTYHYATVDEALRNLPGVEIRRTGSLGKTSSISIRGANSNQVPSFRRTPLSRPNALSL